MHFNLTPFLAIWSVVALAVLVLLAVRSLVASKEDDSLHVMHGTVADQVTVANKLDVIDKWGKILTVVAVVLGLAIAAAYVYDSLLTRGS
jgi:hypothetical protein